MPTSKQTLIDLETKFWQSMVNQDTDTALAMLTEPSHMVSPHGAFKFDHAGYRKMAEQGSMVITSFEMSDVMVAFPNDVTAIVTYHVKQEIATRGEKGRVQQEMNDTSTWVQNDDLEWQCVLHTETPSEGKPSVH